MNRHVSATDARAHLDQLTKPQGSLGRLEDLAAQLAVLQGSLAPAVTAPVALVFAADHGVADIGVSAFPKAVTAQMVLNFLGGGAAISVLARANDFALRIVDAGVDADFAAHPLLIDAKLGRGTANYVDGPAMTAAQYAEALKRSAAIVADCGAAGCNTLLLGEMGIGNTASSALLMHGLTGIELGTCIGRGTGLDDAGLARKAEILRRALARRPLPGTPEELLTEYGGFEIAMLVGAILAGARAGMLVLIDGFTVTAAAAAALAIDPGIGGALVYTHCSAERGHAALLAHLGVRPLLDLGMRLGEGSGAAVALPLVRAAARLCAQMATFASAGVSGRA
jgi:nicotinate-nucleotide--dimethylbenzimidazole phosphoribosyltransferase